MMEGQLAVRREEAEEEEGEAGLRGHCLATPSPLSD